MRRSAVIFVLIFTVLTASVFTGCGTGSSSGSGSAAGSDAESTGSVNKNSPETDNAGSTDAKDPGSEIPETNESAAAWDNIKTEDSQESLASGDPESSFSQVLADQDDLYFAIKDVRKDDIYGCVMKVYIENRTEKNLMFSFEKISVNGIMCDPYWAEVIAAGKKGNCEVTWMKDSFEERQIGDVTEISFTLNVYNDDDYTEPVLMHDPFTIYPLGEERAAQAGPVPVPSDPEQVLVDDERCTVMITGYDPDNSWGYAMKLYLINKTDEDLMFSAEHTSINGIMCDPYWAEIVVSGKSAISTILWDRSSLNKNDITEVKEISLPMRISSDKNYAEPYVDETFELKPASK